MFTGEEQWPTAITVRRQQNGEERWATVPPPSQRLRIVNEAHSLGHFGADKTKECVERSGAWWVGLGADVETVVSRCRACQQDAAHRVVRHDAQLQPMPTGVWDRVHMDILDMGQADDGSQYLLLFVDALSKYPVAFALPTKAAGEIARCLWHVIALFGPMVCLVSDNGSEFVNAVVKALASRYGIQRHLVTAYRPQANGQVERMNRTVLSVFRKLTGTAPRLWPEWVDSVMLAIRSTVSASTGYTPHELMFGRSFHILANYAMVDWAAMQEQGDSTTAAQLLLERRAAEIRMQLGEAWQRQATVTLAHAVEQQRKSTDRTMAARLEERPLAVGTTVYVRLRELGHKLQHRFDGPYVVVHNGTEAVTEGSGMSIPRGMYRLRAPDGTLAARRFARDQVFEVVQPMVKLSWRQAITYAQAEMQAAAERAGEVQPGPLPRARGSGAQGGDGGGAAAADGGGAAAEAAGEEDEEWAVECIEDARVAGGKTTEVLVRWVGYTQPTWIPTTYFPDRELLKRLLTNMRRRKTAQSTRRREEGSAGEGEKEEKG